MSYPLPLTRTEAYLAYKAGVIQQADLKPSLAVPRNGIDAWLAYWTGLADDYPKREDGTPHILQEEEAYIAFLAGVIDEYPEKCLRRVGAYLRYLISARWGRPDHPLNREELYLSLLKTQTVTSGDPSSNIELDGTAEYPFLDVKMYGDTSQNGTPTPDVPVPVQTVTGENVVKICGKNLYDGEISATNQRLSTSTGGGYSSQGWDISSYVSVQPNTTYTINTQDRIFCDEYAIDKTFIKGTAQTYGSTEPITITTTSTTRFIRFDFPTGNASVSMLELGSTATAYEAYTGQSYEVNLGNIELCKIGTYQDYIYKSGDKWYVHKECSKVIKTGTSSEQWSKSNSSANHLFIGIQPDLVKDMSQLNFPVLCDKFVYVERGIIYTQSVIGITTQTTGSGQAAFRVGMGIDSSVNTLELFKTWLSNNPITIYYPLATPTDTEITNESLIEQLEALKNGGSYDGKTYITVSATEPNLPALLVVEAAKYA